MDATTLVSKLTDEQVSDLGRGLVNHIRQETQYMALPMGSAFAAELRVMGFTDEAEQVRAIVNRIVKWRPS